MYVHRVTAPAQQQDRDFHEDEQGERVIRILLADDHVLLRRGLRALLEEHPGWEICAEAEDGREAVELANRLRPDIMVLDLTMPEMSGLEATRLIHESAPEIEILIYSMHESPQMLREVFTAGARGYVLKSDVGQQIEVAVEALANHTTYIAGKLAEMLIQPDPAARLRLLSAREREVARLLAEGKTNKEIAPILKISVKTVESHRTHVFDKLELNTMADLVRYAARVGLIEI